MDFLQVYGINLAFFLGGDLEKRSRFAGPEIFLRFEADLDFQDLDFQKSRCRIKGFRCSYFARLNEHGPTFLLSLTYVIKNV